MPTRDLRFPGLAAVLLVSVTACTTRTAATAETEPSPTWPERPPEAAAPGNEHLDVSPAAITAMHLMGNPGTVTGALSSNDPVLDDGSHYELATFSGSAGDSVDVSLTSETFDTYVYLGRRVARNTVEIFASDDDGGDATDSHIRADLPREGEYVVVASSFTAGETGNYTLSVEPFTGPMVDAVSEFQLADSVWQRLRSVTRGAATDGELTRFTPAIDDDRPYEVWSLSAEEGERLEITLESEEIDTYLYVGILDDEGRFWATDSNDDGGGGTNSRLVFDAPSTGHFAILATTYYGRQHGDYSLGVASWMGDPLNDRIPAAVMADASTAATGRTFRGTIRPDDPTLDDGHRYDVWHFGPTADGDFTIDLRSEDFDAYVQVLAAGGDGPVILAEDDDGGERPLDSLLTVRLEAGTSYLILVRGYGADALGDYTLSLEAELRE